MSKLGISRSAVINFALAVEMSNPNGDIDTGQPRQRYDQRGWISDKAIKRQIRDLIDRNGHQNAIIEAVAKQVGASLANLNIFESAFRGFADAKNEKDAADRAVEMMKKNLPEALKRYFDLRMFGGMPLGSKSKGNDEEAEEEDSKPSSKKKKKDSSEEKSSGRELVVRGCTQIMPPVSIAPIEVIVEGSSKRFPLRDEGKLLLAKQGDLAPGSIKLVQHGLYYGSIFINANESEAVNATDLDVEVLKRLVPMLFTRRSASRSGVFVAHAVMGYHSGRMQSFNEFRFIEACRPKVSSALPAGQSPTSFDQYEIPTIEQIKERMKGSQIEVENLLG